jgi:hypothetical protein
VIPFSMSKSKVVSMLNYFVIKHYTMESGRIDPHFLDLGTSCR